MTAKTPDYVEGQRLAALMLKANPDNGRLRKLEKQLEGLKNSRLQASLPVFSTTDINGKKTDNSLLKGKIGVITTWATWNYQSTDIQRKLRKLQKKYPEKLALISICMDGDKRECRKRSDRDSLLWPVVCDGQLFQSPLVQQLGLFEIPSIVVVDKQGKIIARDIEQNNVEQEIEKFLK